MQIQQLSTVAAVAAASGFLSETSSSPNLSPGGGFFFNPGGGFFIVLAPFPPTFLARLRFDDKADDVDVDVDVDADVDCLLIGGAEAANGTVFVFVLVFAL